jgi:hypothetical protein
MRKALITGLAAMAAAPSAFAFQPCPAPSHPCASVSQVVLFLGLPTLVLLLAVMAAKHWLRRAWLKFSIIALLFVIWLFWVLGVLFAFAAYLAPCSEACWYRF